MCKLIDNNADFIREYCRNNNLNSDKVFASPVCFNNRVAFVQHIDKNAPAIMDNNPAKITLIISDTANGIVIEQTEHTRRYLS